MRRRWEWGGKVKQHPSGHNYARKLLELAAARGLEPGTATRVAI